MFVASLNTQGAAAMTLLSQIADLDVKNEQLKHNAIDAQNAKDAADAAAKEAANAAAVAKDAGDQAANSAAKAVADAAIAKQQ